MPDEHLWCGINGKVSGSVMLKATIWRNSRQFLGCCGLTLKASPSRLPTPLEKKEYSINIFSLFVLSFPSYVNQPVLKDLLCFSFMLLAKFFIVTQNKIQNIFFISFPSGLYK